MVSDIIRVNPNRIYQHIKSFIRPQSVPLSICKTFTGFSFGDQGWHHLIELLKEKENHPDLIYKSSILYCFHQLYRPEGTFELVKDRNNEEVKFKPALGIFPWGSFRIGYGLNWVLETKNWKNSRFCGPTSDDFMKLYDQIKNNGYKPYQYGFIGGTTLKRHNGDERFVVLQGNHRSAILSFLGFDSMSVKPVTGRYNIIKEKDVANWHYVKNNQCSKKDVLAYFNAFFELNSTDLANRFGLV